MAAAAAPPSGPAPAPAARWTGRGPAPPPTSLAAPRTAGQRSPSAGGSASGGRAVPRRGWGWGVVWCSYWLAVASGSEASDEAANAIPEGSGGQVSPQTCPAAAAAAETTPPAPGPGWGGSPTAPAAATAGSRQINQEHGHLVKQAARQSASTAEALCCRHVHAYVLTRPPSITQPPFFALTSSQLLLAPQPCAHAPTRLHYPLHHSP